ncbi:NRDE family protein [Paenibacillus sp. Z3-2]
MNSKYPLILGSNRDEFYHRPTAQAHFWEDYPHILAGRDLSKMGTWMGITTGGRLAAVTNYRDPNEEGHAKCSRGDLVADFLKGTSTPEQYMQRAQQNRNDYPGYNLLVGDPEDFYYYSNVGNVVMKLKPGIYGISNHLINTDWPKVKRGKEELRKIINREGEGTLTEQILDLLQMADPPVDELLPHTGVPLEWERLLSPIFVKSDKFGYGTRASSVVLMTKEKVLFTERVHQNGEVMEQRLEIEYNFRK